MERGHAISFFYKALSRLENNIDARLTLCSLLLEEGKEDEAIGVLSPPKDLLKASRAKKSLQKKAVIREEKKVAALAAGMDWQSDNSEDETPSPQQPPLLEFLKNEEHYQLIIDLCRALASLRQYSDALGVIVLTLRLTNSTISDKQKEELQVLGAQIAYNTTDPKFGSRFKKHPKFLHHMRTQKVCVPPMIMLGHQFTILSQHQSAAREYLEAYKLQPENPLTNLCVGTTLINLALGHRLRNKHQCIAQGLAFLYNYLRICNDSQDAMYNIARAYHHVSLVTLAVSYYEKVLTTQEKDHPIPRLPHEENFSAFDNYHPGFCSLHREATYNLHLIYKKSGAVDLARQILNNIYFNYYVI
ncbi:TPR-like protein [Dioscorea alata]|uniref:TPR-like protein n=1 Tax=Dioscorea alata TaxID=55571 RepID=A0ACB7UCL1_DIOAL|nr:TPR-like protein [Dioscorea alata]